MINFGTNFANESVQMLHSVVYQLNNSKDDLNSPMNS